MKYEDNGKYKNAKKSDLTVIEKNANLSANNASNSPKNDSKAQPNATTQCSSQKANNGSTGAKSTKILVMLNLSQKVKLLCLILS